MKSITFNIFEKKYHLRYPLVFIVKLIKFVFIEYHYSYDEENIVQVEFYHSVETSRQLQYLYTVHKIKCVFYCEGSNSINKK